MKILNSGLHLTILIFLKFGESSRRPEKNWEPPTPENDEFFTAHEAARLLSELDSPSTHSEHTNRDHHRLPRPKKLKSMEGEGSSSGSPRKRGRPTGSLTPLVDGVKRGAFRVGDSRPLPVEGPPTEIIEYMEKKIHVWLNPPRTRVLKADFPGNTFPLRTNFYFRKNFLVRRTFVKYGDMVQYIWANGTLMGIRAPKPTKANVMEPTDTTWFIVYRGEYFRLTVNPETQVPVGIELIPKNAHDITHIVEDAELAGIKFKVFIGRRPPRIMGAELPPRRSPSPEVRRST